MDESDFEGTLELERLAEIGHLDAFWEAIDDDDVETASRLMKRANIDSRIISIVLHKIADPDGQD